jgi:hypothetical protein
MDGGEWIHAPRLPLIDPYRGVCRSGEAFEPAEEIQREMCNCGYARGRCDRFLADSADAVRFSVVAENSSALRVLYVFEKDCAPLSHGVWEYPGSAGSGVLERQIAAFAESYRRRDQRQSSRGGENVSIAIASSSTTAE